MLLGLLELLAGCPGAAAPPAGDTSGGQRTARRQMVALQIQARGVRDRCVLQAMERVPRHLFVPPTRRRHAYEDRALPIAHGQTISQPYVVAVMTEAAGLSGGERVLEVGTGSGYQAAVLSQCAGEVYSVEIIPELAREAAARLRELGYTRIQVRQGNGRLGWPGHAPYDVILVTAAAREIPPLRVKQLRDGGVLVMPRGPRGGRQVLIRAVKRGTRLDISELLPVAFVPLVYGGPSQGSPVEASGAATGAGEANR